MAKVKGPFKVVGTLGDVNYYIDQNNNNIAREKGKTGVTSEQFKTNPVFEEVKKHAAEFGRAAKKAVVFRAIAQPFFNRAKDGRFAGRANKLMLEILEADTQNQRGQRMLENGMESQEARTYPIGFEGNKLRPLNKVLKTNWLWNEKSSQLTIENFNPKTNIDWPENADHVHLAIARANWNYEENKFATEFSQEITFQKEAETTKLLLQTNIPPGNHLQLVYLFIGFSIQERKKLKELKRSNNTITIIWTK